MYKKTFRPALPALSLVVVGSLALGGCRQEEKPASAPPATPAVSVETRTLQLRSVERMVEVPGSVRAELSTVLTSKIMGRVIQVSVREGDRVVQGQPLVRLEADDLGAADRAARASLASTQVAIQEARRALAHEAKAARARIAMAAANLDQAIAARSAARAKLDLTLAGPRKQEVEQARIAVQTAQSGVTLAQSEFNRTSTLVSEGALARRELEVAQNRLDQAKGQLSAAQAALSIAQEGSRQQDIRQARDGLGQADASVKAARASLESARANALQVGIREAQVRGAITQRQAASAQVDSTQVALSYSVISAPFDGAVTLRSADPGSLASPGLPLLTIEGGSALFVASVPEKMIRTIRPGLKAKISLDALHGFELRGVVAEISPRASTQSRAVEVKFRMEPAPGLKAGMFGRLGLVQDSVKLLTVPAGAVRKREGLEQVFVVGKDRIARLRIVTLGRARGGEYEVLSGLTPGEAVVLSNLDRLTDGMAVK